MSTVRKNDARLGGQILSEDKMLKLMAYADGELEGADLEEVETWIAGDATSVRFTNEMAGLGELVQIGFGKSTDAKAVASFDIADAIMAKVKTQKIAPAREEKSEKSEPKTAPVVSIHARRTAAQRNVRFGVAAVAVLALAASVALMMKSSGPAEQPMARAPVVAPTANPTAPSTVAVNADPNTNPTNNTANANAANGSVEVNVEQTAGNSVSVFYVPSETEALTTSVVVWVDDTGGK